MADQHQRPATGSTDERLAALFYRFGNILDMSGPRGENIDVNAAEKHVAEAREQQSQTATAAKKANLVSRIIELSKITGAIAMATVLTAVSAPVVAIVIPAGLLAAAAATRYSRDRARNNRAATIADLTVRQYQRNLSVTRERASIDELGKSIAAMRDVGSDKQKAGNALVRFGKAAKAVIDVVEESVFVDLLPLNGQAAPSNDSKPYLAPVETSGGTERFGFNGSGPHWKRAAAWILGSGAVGLLAGPAVGGIAGLGRGIVAGVAAAGFGRTVRNALEEVSELNAERYAIGRAIADDSKTGTGRIARRVEVDGAKEDIARLASDIAREHGVDLKGIGFDRLLLEGPTNGRPPQGLGPAGR